MTPSPGAELRVLESVIAEAKAVARRYRILTGRSLGITDEIAEYECARMLSLSVCSPETKGCNAQRSRDGKIQRLQVRGNSGDEYESDIISIDPRSDWDALLIVLMDMDFEPLAIYKADRASVEQALRSGPKSISSYEWSIDVCTLKLIGEEVWNRQRLIMQEDLDVFRNIAGSKSKDKPRARRGESNVNILPRA